jgi:hypothetical protein
MDLLRSARVRIVTFAAHTTQIFQLLDLTLFEIFKREGKSRLPFGDLGTTVNFVYNVYAKMEKTLTSPNIWAAFQTIGVEWCLTREASHIVPCCLSQGQVEGVEGIRSTLEPRLSPVISDA